MLIMKSFGFKKTIITSIVILTTLSLLISNWAAYIPLKNQTVQTVNDHSKDIMRNEVETIETWFKNKVLLIDSLADRYENKTHIDDLAHSLDYVAIAKLAKKISGISDIYLGFEDGRMYGTATGDMWINGVAKKDKYDPRSRPWYQQAKGKKSPVVTDFYTDAVTGQAVISIARNFGDGVALGDVSLNVLVDAVKSIDFPGAVSIITDETGKAMASNSSILTVGTQLTDVGMNEVQKAMLSQDETSSDYTINGVEKIAFTEAINLINGKKWYLIVGVDKSIAFAQVEQAKTSALITALILVFITIALVLVILNIAYRPILSLKDMVVDLSEGNGDLTRRLPVNSNDDLGQISQGINQFIANLQVLMQEVSQSSEHISGSVDHLKQQAETNTQVLAAHSMETEQIVSAVEEMSATARDVAGNASEASRFTNDTNVQVANSLNVVTEATNTVSQLSGNVENTSVSIEEIGKDTLDISKVLNVIGEIADQTNLLALNAAIEAARAGEQGRGFAVVADEVRALAARTQSSTAEIEQMLNKLLAASKTSIAAMSETKSTCDKTTQNTSLVATELDSIASSVTNINDFNTLIATAAEEQSSVAADITRNMSTISEMVAELSINGEASANETTNLATANSQLKSVVGKFKLQ